MVIGAIILSFLSENGPSSTAELAEFLPVSDRTIRKVLTNLKKSGMVSEKIDLDDVRRKRYAVL